MKISDKVRTVRGQTPYGWQDEFYEDRRWDALGIIVSGEGPYLVRHEDGAERYYAIWELTLEPVISTCHRQEISVGVQVAYAKPVDASVNNFRMYNNIHISGGTLCVSTVTHIEQTSVAFAEADASFMLTLANGDKVNLDDVCVTDGIFEYGGKIA